MNFSSTVTEISEDELTKTSWSFINVHRLEMTLNIIEVQTRKSKRHKWQTTQVWNRIYSRENNMQREEPPQWVKDAVVTEMLEAIKFD